MFASQWVSVTGDKKGRCFYCFQRMKPSYLGFPWCRFGAAISVPWSCVALDRQSSGPLAGAASLSASQGSCFQRATCTSSAASPGNVLRLCLPWSRGHRSSDLNPPSGREREAGAESGAVFWGPPLTACWVALIFHTPDQVNFLSWISFPLVKSQVFCSSFLAWLCG